MREIKDVCMVSISAKDMARVLDAVLALFREAIRQKLIEIEPIPDGGGDVNVVLGHPFSITPAVVREYMDAAFKPADIKGGDDFGKAISQAVCKASSFVFLAKGGSGGAFPASLASLGKAAEDAMASIGINGPCGVMYMGLEGEGHEA